MTTSAANEITEAADRLVEAYRQRRDVFASGESADALRRRDDAIERFREVGLPSPKNEEWKYTSFAPIARTEFSFDPSRAPSVGAEDVKPYLLAGSSGPTLVFINGELSRELSSLSGVSGALEVSPLVAGERFAPDLDDDPLDRCADLGPLPFAQLNTAMMSGGVMIRAPREAVGVDPIQLIFIAAGRDAPVASFPRVVIVAEQGSQATVVENHVALDGAPTLTDCVTEILARENAHIDHYRVTELNEGDFHIGAIAARQMRDSVVSSCVVSIGGDITRNDFRVVLDGEGADCNLRGLAMLTGREHVDNHLLVRHAKPHCTSREFFKNVLDENSRGVFCGRIYVDQDAQKTDGVQTNANLLLSDDAQAEARPQLEIYADDVKCTHAATIGQLDEEAIFYLRARGISEAAARGMLVRGFAGEILDEIRVESLRDRLRERLFAAGGRLPSLQASV